MPCEQARELNGCAFFTTRAEGVVVYDLGGRARLTMHNAKSQPEQTGAHYIGP